MTSTPRYFILKNVKPLALACLATFSLSLNATPDPHTRGNNSWISLSGKAVSSGGQSFVLDYGTGTVIVEMDDWGWYGPNAKVLEGDNITVYGKIDDDLFEKTSIEASSVYVENLGTYFHANPTDEEGSAAYLWLPAAVIQVGEITLTGKVTSVDNRKFTIDTGNKKMTVDTSAMQYNPMDDAGYQKIKKGDIVSVNADLAIDTFKKREVVADRIVTLDSSGKKSGSS